MEGGRMEERKAGRGRRENRKDGREAVQVDKW